MGWRPSTPAAGAVSDAGDPAGDGADRRVDGGRGAGGGEEEAESGAGQGRSEAYGAAPDEDEDDDAEQDDGGD
ncbi:hypothetical protein SHJG_p1088 (plasmid) [Streptomyces hygroscopicus subsp. jinggangensis 5008]|nr:hypothetical protein SHJG_p1088 [Streptomyces hygroscopicus subsp. jinggangensis 5008]AGF68373.1 hypothetical protein SHJGH_p1088 [Streptomyces hygroscopicus subsp. jinggangensis TL01]